MRTWRSSGSGGSVSDDKPAGVEGIDFVSWLLRKADYWNREALTRLERKDAGGVEARRFALNMERRYRTTLRRAKDGFR